MQAIQQIPAYVPQQPPAPEPNKKIEVENYDQYIHNRDGQFDDLNISEDDSEENWY